VPFNRNPSMREDIWHQIQLHRLYLLRVARLQLRDHEAAEDAVQETLLAALSSAASFDARSSVKTWLVQILKHKIVDVFRHKRRETARASGFEKSADGEENEAGDPDAFMAASAGWGNAEQQVAQKQFLQTMESCLVRLPRKQARAFVLREVLECDVPEICAALQITAAHFYVLLHRARMSLRRSLEPHGFGP